MKKIHWMLKFLWMWPPFLGTGIRIKSFSDDLSCIVVQMKTRFWSQNYFGTHYGGSLFSMTDPFYALMLVHILGKEYIVWDKAAFIRYKVATKRPVYARFELSPEKIQQLKSELEQQHKIEPTFCIPITDEEGTTIALVERTLHIRRKDSVRKN